MLVAFDLLIDTNPRKINKLKTHWNKKKQILIRLQRSTSTVLTPEESPSPEKEENNSNFRCASKWILVAKVSSQSFKKK